MNAKRWALLSLVAVAALLLWLALTAEGPTPAPGPLEPAAPAKETDAGSRRSRLDPEAPERPAETPVAGRDHEEPAPDPGRLQVLVVTRESGAPIEGARVLVEADRGETHELVTDEDGTASLSPAPGGKAEVSAHVVGRVRDVARIEGTEPGAQREVTLRLAAGQRLWGRVLDRDRRPLAGVRLEFEEGGSLGGMASSAASPLLGSSVTDEAGGFAFDRIPADEIVTVLAQHPGHAYFQRSLRVPEGGALEPVEIRLAPGGAVGGFVRGPGQRPVEGARVLVVPSDAEYLLDDPDANMITTGGASQSRALEGRSDAQGRFLVHGLAFDAPYVALAALPGLGRSERAEGLVARDGAPTVVVDLRLRALSELTLHVLDEDGQRIEGATVLCLTGAFRQIEAGSDGSFVVDALGAGDVTLDVDADGYVKRRITHPFAGRGDESLDVRLARGLTIAGVAVNDLGEPLADARIRAMRPLGSDLPGSLADTRTDSEGRFEVGGLLPGAHQVLCWAEGHDRGRAEPVEAGADDVRVVSLRHGRVVVTLRIPEGRSPPAKLGIQKMRAGGGSGTECDWPQDGRLEQGVAPGGVLLVLVAEGYADLPFQVDLAPGATLDLGTVSLDDGTTLTGRVVDLEGRPVEGAEIRAAPDWAFEGQVARTDSDGRFRLARLSRTAYEVQVAADGFLGQDHTWEIRSPHEERALTLARGGLVHGRVARSDGVGIADGTVWLVPLDVDDPDETSDFGYPGNTGDWGVRVPPGRYRVEYRPEDGDPIPVRDVQLAEGSRERVDVVVPE